VLYNIQSVNIYFEEKEEPDECMDVPNSDEIIDLRTPVNATAPSLDDLTTHRTAYKSQTLALNSHRRYALPAFPTTAQNEHVADLLLANVPGKWTIGGFDISYSYRRAFAI
jgi:hypothetical protein